MSRILLIGNYLPDRQPSMLRYADWLAHALAGRGYQVDLVQPTVRLGGLVDATNLLAKWLGYVDKFLLFPVELLFRVRRYDLIHICDHSNAPYFRFARGVPVLVTCHDLLAIRGMLGEFREHRPGFTGRLLQKWILSSLRSIELICCVSESTRSDVIRVAGKDSTSTRTVANPVIGYAPMLQADAEAILPGAGLAPSTRFVLHVGGNLWYKNRLGMIELFGQMVRHQRLAHLHLVCAGSAFTQELRSAIARLDIADRVHEVVSPSSTMLRALYSKADSLLFVSLQEGFGWPIVEAQACGCAVITTDREPMRGIAGACALTVDPLDPVEAACSIDRNWDWLATQRDASLANAARFSENAAIENYAGLYDTALTKAAGRP